MNVVQGTRDRMGIARAKTMQMGAGGAASSLLLDNLSNVAAAYSFRKLRTAYAGSAVRIRRSSDNAEQDIGFVANEFDTASAASFIGGGSGYVAMWYDQSGNENDFAQATASKQPLYVASGFEQSPYQEYDGANDTLVIANNPLYQDTEWTAYLVYRSRETGTSDFPPILQGESGNAKGINIYDVHETTFSLNDDSIGVIAGAGENHVRSSLTNSVPPNTPVIGTVAWKDGQNPPVVIRVNGVNQTPLGGSGSGAFSIVWDSPDFGLAISANPPGGYLVNTAAKIDVAEIILISAQDSSTVWETIEASAMNFYGIS